MLFWCVCMCVYMHACSIEKGIKMRVEEYVRHLNYNSIPRDQKCGNCSAKAVELMRVFAYSITFWLIQWAANCSLTLIGSKCCKW